jgi:predicted DNA-binding protein (UPF0251 family)
MPSFKHLHPDMEWRDCPSLDGYQVSEYGHLRRVVEMENHSSRYPKGREYSYGLAGKGYPFYNIKVGDKRKNFYAHKLVAESFIGCQPNGTEVAHNDGDKLNCHYRNLRYATPSENNQDKRLHGTHQSGDTHPMVKLKTDQAEAVILMRELGYSQDAIGKFYSVSQTAVGRFLKRLTNAQLQSLTS